MQISAFIQPYNGPYCPHCGESIKNADRMPQLSGNHCAGIGTSVLAQKTARIAQMQIEIDAVTKQRDDTYAKLVEARTKIQSLTFGLKMMPGSDH